MKNHMNPKTTRMLAAGAVVVVALALLLIVRPGDSDNGSSDENTNQEQATSKTTGNTGPRSAPQSEPPQPEKPAVPVYRVVDGQPAGGVQKLEVNEGDNIRFVVKSDVDDEVHVHGFDVSEPVGPGKPAKFDFKAGFTGVFEIELENSAVPIIELQVNP